MVLQAFMPPLMLPKKNRWWFFTLEPLAQTDDRHAFIIWGDTQIWDKEDARQLNEVSAPETRKVIESLGNQPVHGIALGDLVFDKFELFPRLQSCYGENRGAFFPGNWQPRYGLGRS